MKNFCGSKDTINRVKRQPMEWEKTFANRISDNELISRIHKEFLPLNNKTNNLIKKQEKDLKRQLSKEVIQMANKHIKKCSTSLIIREMHIKTTMRYHLIPNRITTIKKMENNKSW